MIFNATLLRLNPPDPGEPGPDINVRCALTPPTAEQGRASRARAIDVRWIAYIPQSHVPSPGPEEGGVALIRADGSDATPFRIMQATQLAGRTIRYVQIFLAPVE